MTTVGTPEECSSSTMRRPTPCSPQTIACPRQSAYTPPTGPGWHGQVSGGLRGWSKAGREPEPDESEPGGLSPGGAPKYLLRCGDKASSRCGPGGLTTNLNGVRS